MSSANIPNTSRIAYPLTQQCASDSTSARDLVYQFTTYKAAFQRIICHASPAYTTAHQRKHLTFPLHLTP
eukprot:735399-Pelagomonas_calceolata.AAC.1